MKIGLVSDSHGRAGRLEAAVKALASRGAEIIIHCGDIGSLQCLQALAQGGLPAYLAPGNMDRHIASLVAQAEAFGVKLSEVVEITLGDGRHLAATHGHDQAVLGGLMAGGRFAYICHGHTHKPRDTRIGPVRVINPGALYNAHRFTAAMLDAAADTLEFIRLD